MPASLFGSSQVKTEIILPWGKIRCEYFKTMHQEIVPRDGTPYDVRAITDAFT